MKTQDYKLHKFLRKHGAVRKFKKAVIIDGNDTYEEVLVSGETDTEVISGAFIWIITPQGITYWSDLDHKYMNSPPVNVID